MKLEQAKRAEYWCEELLRFEGNAEDVDGLVGRGEAALIKEQFEEAVRSFERAFELSGRSSQDVSSFSPPFMELEIGLAKCCIYHSFLP